MQGSMKNRTSEKNLKERGEWCRDKRSTKEGAGTFYSHKSDCREGSRDEARQRAANKAFHLPFSATAESGAKTKSILSSFLINYTKKI